MGKRVKSTVKKIVKTIKRVLTVTRKAEDIALAYEKKTLEYIESKLNIALKVVLIVINTSFLIKRIPEEQRVEVLRTLRRTTEILRSLGAFDPDKEGD